MRWAKNLQLWNEEHRVILKQRAKYWCVWEKSVHTSERISSFNICEMLENHNQHQAEKTGKWRIVNYFFFSFSSESWCFYACPSCLSGSGKKSLIWNKHNLPRGLCCPLGCGGVHPSAEFRKAPGSEAQLEIFEYLVFSHAGWRVLLSSSPPAAPPWPSRSCLGQQRFLQQNICLKGWGLPDQAQATLGISDELSARRVLRRAFAVLTQSSHLAGPFSLPFLYVPVVSYFFLITKSQFNAEPAQFPCTV